VTRVTTPHEGRPHAGWDDTAAIPAPLRPHRTPVLPEWTDYNGHMSESCYLLVFGDSADAFFRYVGVDEAYRDAGHSLFTAQTMLHHLREAHQDDQLTLELRVLDHDERRVHVYHEMYGDGRMLLAAAEQLLVHVDTLRGGSTPMPDDLLAHVRAVRAAHQSLPVPGLVGRPLRIRRP
jgi:carnitine 3-dehydrogenase